MKLTSDGNYVRHFDARKLYFLLQLSKTRLKILPFYRFFRRNSSSPEICFNDGRCVSPAWVSDLLGDFHKNQEKVLKFLVEIVTKLQVIATQRFLKEQKKRIYPNERVHREAAFLDP